MRGIIVTAYHIRNSTDIVLWVRTENGKRKVVVRGFVPYFYVPSPDGKYLSLDYERVKKVVCNCPEDVPRIRERYTKHYEANILFVHRFLIDKGIFEGVRFADAVVTPDQISPYNCDDIDYNLCYFDIEVANKGTPITPEYVERAPDPVICFTIYTKGKYLTVVWRADFKERYEKVADNWYILYRSNERDLLYDFASIIDKIDPDVLIAWNSTSFDLPYLKNRMKQYDIKLDWSKFADFDLMRAYASFVLNKKNKYIGLKEAVVNEGIADKDEVKEFDLNWWRFDIDTLLKYNRDDVKYMVQIDAKRGLFSGARDRRFLAGLPSFNDTFYPRSLIDSACLREAKEQCVVLPTYPLDKKAESYEGGKVFQPDFGVYKNVAVFDFSRYYPSIMFSFYLDPLIYYIYKKEKDKERDELNLRDYLEFAKPYAEKGRTVVLNALNKFMKLRNRIDAKIEKLEPGSREYERYTSMKQAVKAIINAFYGTSGDEEYRLFTMPIATTVTAIGREGIEFVRRYLEKNKGYKVIYGDSVHGNTRIPVFTSSGKFKYLTIEELFNHYEQLKTTKEYRVDGKEVLNVSGHNIYTISTNEHGIIKICKIRRIIRHKVNKKLYKVTTESGKSVIVTEDHSLMVWKNNKLVSATPKVLDTDSKLYVFDVDMLNLLQEVQNNDRFDITHNKASQNNTSRLQEEVSDRKVFRTKESDRATYSSKQTENAGAQKIRRTRRTDFTGVNKRESSRATTGRKVSSLWKTSKTSTSTLLVETRNNSNRAEREVRFELSRDKESPYWMRKGHLEQRSNKGRYDRENGRKAILRVATKERRKDKKMGSVKRWEKGNAKGSIQSLNEYEEIWNKTRKDFVYIFENIRSASNNAAKTLGLGRFLCDTRYNSECCKYGSGSICGWLLLARLPAMLSECSRGKRISKAQCQERQRGKQLFQRNEIANRSSMGARSDERYTNSSRESSEYYQSNPRVERITRVEEYTEINSNYLSNGIYVYDLEVDECHTFLANCIFVHNTDSVMVQCSLEEASDIANELTGLVNEYFASKYGVKTNIKIKFEKFFKAVFFKEVKKRYAYWCTFEDGKECDYIGFKGFELVRGDSSPFIKRMQEEMFEIILKKDPSELVSWLLRIVKEFRSAKLSEIAIPKGLNKSFDSYDSMQSFVRGAIYANTYLGETITPGRTVYMLYVRSVKGKPRTDVVSLSSPEKFDELADIIEVDWDRMIEFSIRNKVEEIFKKFGLPFSISGRQLTL